MVERVYNIHGFISYSLFGSSSGTSGRRPLQIVILAFFMYISFFKRLDAQALSCRQHGFSSLNVVTSWPESLVDKLK